MKVPKVLYLTPIVSNCQGVILSDYLRHAHAKEIGGPSGGCVPASMADLPVDYESLMDAAAIMCTPADLSCSMKPIAW